MKLVQLPTVAFEQRVKEELDENPALESSDNENWDEEEDYEDPFDTGQEAYEDSLIIQADAINVMSISVMMRYLIIVSTPIVITILMRNTGSPIVRNSLPSVPLRSAQYFPSG